MEFRVFHAVNKFQGNSQIPEVFNIIAASEFTQFWEAISCYFHPNSAKIV